MNDNSAFIEPDEALTPLNSLEFTENVGDNCLLQLYLSVFYTGYPLFLIAILWFILLGLFLLLLCVYVCCCRRRHYGYPKFACGLNLSVFFLLLFTIAAACSTVESTCCKTKSSVLFVFLKKSSCLVATKNVGVNHIFLPRQLQTDIDNVNGMITTAATTLERTTKNNKDDISRYLDVVRRVLIAVALVMLFLNNGGSIVSIIGPHFLIYFLVFFSWIFIAFTFFMSGIFLALHNATGDTCAAMHEWVDNPTAHTALDQIIPCMDPATSQEARSQSREVTIQMVQLVNGIIANVSNRKFPNAAQMAPLFCNPYNPDRTYKRMCPAGEVDLNNATQLKMAYINYECCLTPSLYDVVSRAVNLSYGLHHYGPFLSDLADCTFLRDTFTTIYDRHCPGLREDSQWVYIGLFILSTGLFLSMLSWVPVVREIRLKPVHATSAQVSAE
ncbi:Unknown protein [Striga hermonthica]|uniref:Uncharacterized protein n=1 Tax=Striga hermonthica TaxID=68872 RepID=A0A9N7NEM5_STRHE|nr:Unknown protein [Striga hermonthica]